MTTIQDRAGKSALPLLVPVAVIGVMGFHRRWVAEDAFITLRVVKQIGAGNGPSFNATERVEASTSTLWTWLLAAADLVTPFRLEWIAVALGLAATLGGVAAVARYSIILNETESSGEEAARAASSADGQAAVVPESAPQATRRYLVPVGLLALAGLAPFWDYSTSGLETGLCTLWIGVCALALVRPMSGRRARLSAAFLIGLGPLIRPDFALYSVVFLVAVLVILRPSRRDAIAFIAATASLTVLYGIARAGYYGTLVPNTALAKEASRLLPRRGAEYLWDFVGTYFLIIPLLLALIQAFILLRRQGDPRTRVALLALPVSGGLHVVYLVAIGGDYMHGRLLLTGLMAAVAPIAVVPVTARIRPVRSGSQERGPAGYASAARAFGVLLVLGWAVVAGTSLRQTATGSSGLRLLDEHDHMVGMAKQPHPVDIEDYRESSSFDTVRQVERLAGNRTDVVAVSDGPDQFALPGREGVGRVAIVRFIGVIGYALPLDVHVVDLLSLADPLGSRIELQEPGFAAGHEKSQPLVWPIARFARVGPAEDPALTTTRSRLRCSPVHELMESIEAPLTWRRFLDNLAAAPAQTTLRVGSSSELFPCDRQR